MLLGSIIIVIVADAVFRLSGGGYFKRMLIHQLWKFFLHVHLPIPIYLFIQMFSEPLL